MRILDRVIEDWLSFPHPINHMHNSFSPSDNLVHKVDVYFCQGGERMGQPSFSPPLTSNFMFYAYSG